MVYGIGTRSYNRSTEKRQMDRERAEATANYEAQPKREIVMPLTCCCLSFQWPHEISEHRKLRSEWDWRPWQERLTHWTEYF